MIKTHADLTKIQDESLRQTVKDPDGKLFLPKLETRPTDKRPDSVFVEEVLIPARRHLRFAIYRPGIYVLDDQTRELTMERELPGNLVEASSSDIASPGRITLPKRKRQGPRDDELVVPAGMSKSLANALRRTQHITSLNQLHDLERLAVTRVLDLLPEYPKDVMAHTVIGGVLDQQGSDIYHVMALGIRTGCWERVASKRTEHIRRSQ